MMVSLSSIATSTIISQQAKASSTWNAEEIIDDIIFTNKNAMDANQIQDFLNSKVINCDTDGSQLATDWGRSDLTHAQYAAIQISIAQAAGKSTNWNNPPYTCLKDYTENSVSSAQIIYNASQQYGINPEVLIVLLQKEQGLVTDIWPLIIQYRSATGYACSDSSPCESEYYGLTNQVNWAARMYRSIMNDSPTWNKQYYPYWVTDPITGVAGPRYVNYSPVKSCGGTWINIQNRATQALYNYTPYQPNQAALSAPMGAVVDCGAYGNINFYRYFTSWFGPTTNSHLIFSVIQGPNSSALYLQTSAGKYYILSGELMKAWGIDTLPIQQVSQSYLDSLKTGPNLGKLLKDDWNNYFVVENKKIHYIRDLSYLTLWGINSSDAVQSLGLVYTLPNGNWLGRFVSDSTQPTDPIWLIDNGQKHLIDDKSMLYQWGYTSDQLTTLSTAFLNTIPTNTNNVTAFAGTTSTSYVIDTGRKLSFNNSGIQSAYYGTQNPVVYSPITLSFLPTETASQFVVDSLNGQWFMLENDKKHYIISSTYAESWGKTNDTPLTVLNDITITTIPTADNLTNIVQTSDPSKYWLVDNGIKHYISDSNTANAWIKQGTYLPLYSTQSLNLLSNGSDATTTINPLGSSYFYTLDNGIRHYLMSPGSMSGWGNSVTTLSASFVNIIPEGSFLNYIVKNTSGQAYLLMNNLNYLIDPLYYNDWGVSDTTTVVADATINRYASSGKTLRAFININDKSYMMSDGNKAPIISNNDTYQTYNFNPISLPNDYFKTIAETTYLAKSTNNEDEDIWLISNGKKYLFNSFMSYVTYGYLSRGIPLTPLKPEVLSLIPDSSEIPGLFIRTSTSFGVKFLNFGTSLGFPDGDTLVNLLGSTPVLVVSDSIYNSFPVVGSASRVIKDDSGKLYLVESGKKRWITNAKSYARYSSIPITYLYGTTIELIPTGLCIED